MFIYMIIYGIYVYATPPNVHSFELCTDDKGQMHQMWWEERSCHKVQLQEKRCMLMIAKRSNRQELGEMHSYNTRRQMQEHEQSPRILLSKLMPWFRTCGPRLAPLYRPTCRPHGLVLGRTNFAVQKDGASSGVAPAWISGTCQCAAFHIWPSGAYQWGACGSSASKPGLVHCHLHFSLWTTFGNLSLYAFAEVWTVTLRLDDHFTIGQPPFSPIVLGDGSMTWARGTVNEGSKGTWLAALRQARPLFCQIWTCGDISFVGGRFSAHKHMFLANLLQMLLHVLNDFVVNARGQVDRSNRHTVAWIGATKLQDHGKVGPKDAGTVQWMYSLVTFFAATTLLGFFSCECDFKGDNLLRFGQHPRAGTSPLPRTYAVFFQEVVFIDDHAVIYSSWGQENWRTSKAISDCEAKGWNL